MSDAAELVFARLTHEEGERLRVYDDATGLTIKAPQGNVTWGRGFNIDAIGSPALFDVIERYLIDQHEAALLKYPWYAAIDPVRQSVLLDVSYNSGSLLGFPAFTAACARGDWPAAADQLHVKDPNLDASRYAPLRALLLSG